MENARLRDAHPGEAVRIDSEEEVSRWQAEAARYQSESESHAAEAARLRQLYEQLLCDTQAMQEELAQVAQSKELERQTSNARELESRYSRQSAEMAQTRERAELECYRQRNGENGRLERSVQYSNSWKQSKHEAVSSEEAIAARQPTWRLKELSGEDVQLKRDLQEAINTALSMNSVSLVEGRLGKEVTTRAKMCRPEIRTHSHTLACMQRM